MGGQAYALKADVFPGLLSESDRELGWKLLFLQRQAQPSIPTSRGEDLPGSKYKQGSLVQLYH